MVLQLMFNLRMICVWIHFSMQLDDRDTMTTMVITGTMLFQGELGSLTVYAGFSKASYKTIEKQA